MMTGSSHHCRHALRMALAILLALPLAACLEVAVSQRGFDFPAATPALPFRDNGFELLARSEVGSVNAMATAMVNSISIRVDRDGRHHIVTRNPPRAGAAVPAEHVTAARYFALPDNPSVLAIRVNVAHISQADAVPPEMADAYFYAFIEKTADIIQLLPFNRGVIEAWRPATEADRLLREQVMRLRPDGQGQSGTYLIEDATQLERVLRLASRLPPAQRATLRIRDAATMPPPQAAAPAAPAPAPAPAQATRWQFRQWRDPVTRVVTQFANLHANGDTAGTGPVFQVRCVGPRLEFLFDTRAVPLRNELNEGRVRAALMEINFDDREVRRLMWPIADRRPQLVMDPNGMGGLVALAGILNSEVQRSITDWNAAWLLNTMTRADTVVLRVWDSMHNAHVLRFSPRASLADFRANLQDCVR